MLDTFRRNGEQELAAIYASGEDAVSDDALYREGAALLFGAPDVQPRRDA
jgi:hypothetical protein